MLNWTGRLSASIFGAYLTAILVDGVFREREREKEKSIQQTAFQELTPALHRQKILIELLYRAGAPEPVSQDEISNLKQLVDSEDFEEIRMVDFSEIRPGDLGSEDRTWLEELEYTHKNLEKSINQVIEKYTYVLDPGLIQHLHSLANAGFTSFIDIHRTLPSEEESDFLLRDIEYSSFSKYLYDLECV